MKYRITLDHAEVNLKVTVKSESPQKLRLKVYDAKNPDRIFTNRYKTIHGQEVLFVRMPLSPAVAVVEVTPETKGEPKPFSFVNVEKLGLEKRISVNQIQNARIRSFVEFAQRFCYNVYELNAPEYYKSGDGEFYINLLPKIISKEGKEMNTPARVSRRSGIIQCSKSQLMKFTVPMNFAILCHEFSHFYLNEQMDDEIEADLNGLLIYLGLGYPRIEAYQAFLETFKGVPSQQNKERYDVINKFIEDFEKIDMVIQ